MCQKSLRQKSDEKSGREESCREKTGQKNRRQKDRQKTGEKSGKKEINNLVPNTRLSTERRVFILWGQNFILKEDFCRFGVKKLLKAFESNKLFWQ